MDESISAGAVVCTLILMGAIQSAFSAFSIFRQQQYYLAAWLGFFSLEIASKGLLYLDVLPSWTQWFGYWFSFDITYGPLLLLWILKLTSNKPLSKWHLLHFLPAAGYLALTLPEALSMPSATRMERVNNYLSAGEWVSYNPETTQWLSGLLWHPYAYVLLALAYLIGRRNQVQPITYRWLMSMLLVHLAMWCAVIFGLEWLPLSLPLVFLASYLPAVLWVNFLAWLSLSYLQLKPTVEQKQPLQPNTFNELERQTAITTPPPCTTLTKPTEQPVATKEKYQHTRLDQDQQILIATQLDNLMSQGAFKRSRLSLAEVADEIGIAPHYVSQVVNDHYQNHFSDFVNKYRIKAIKAQLLDAQLQQQTILEIALANGFSSKATFNAVFKKETGVTPSSYRKQKNHNKCDVEQICFK
ncbi:helix-turn-helix transcriptional regulator [Motilimonas sp. 1_MG-2023]|uniref:helix-turn-helix domain-containing protein n=1 Tax=Motilimonas sp. 1_MG-2023 TaxID=3062672 RepID=UPI0026E324E5|nr:helix-turn-helix transcriptional regulator [Motilimonas sp. 1_MG-2023]MDO6526248.1 helix-turn-helix transcriptional regulator [Motilimonas sp. 1_MG-2023]